MILLIIGVRDFFPARQNDHVGLFQKVVTSINVLCCVTKRIGRACLSTVAIIGISPGMSQFIRLARLVPVIIVGVGFIGAIWMGDLGDFPLAVIKVGGGVTAPVLDRCDLTSGIISVGALIVIGVGFGLQQTGRVVGHRFSPATA